MQLQQMLYHQILAQAMQQSQFPTMVGLSMPSPFLRFFSKFNYNKIHV